MDTTLTAAQGLNPASSQRDNKAEYSFAFNMASLNAYGLTRNHRTRARARVIGSRRTGARGRAQLSVHSVQRARAAASKHRRKRLAISRASRTADKKKPASPNPERGGEAAGRPLTGFRGWRLSLHPRGPRQPPAGRRSAPQRHCPPSPTNPEDRQHSGNHQERGCRDADQCQSAEQDSPGYTELCRPTHRIHPD